MTLPAGYQAVVAVQVGWWDGDIALGPCSWQELVPESDDIRQAPAVEFFVDPPGQHDDTVASCGDVEQGDGIAAGLPFIKLVFEGLPGSPVGVIGEQRVSVDEVAQCTGLAAQVSDHVPKIDAVPPVRMTDPHTRRGHYLVWAEEELDAIVKEMRIEAPSNEAGGHRIDNPVDADSAVAGDMDGDHGEIGGPLGRQCLEYLTLCINARGMPPVLSGDLCINGPRC